VDNNCSGEADEGLSKTTFFADADGDGYGDSSASLEACSEPQGYVENDTDCDDTDAEIHPGKLKE
jgi:hypothetical protein